MNPTINKMDNAIIPSCKVDLTSDRLSAGGKRYMVISVNAEKSFDKT